MAQRDKLIEQVRNNPRDVRFDDACRIAEMLGFRHRGGSGSHLVYGRPGEATPLVFQNRQGKIKPYQARQLIEMIAKYEEEL